MILKAWGDWALFQELLTVLRSIGDRHRGVSIANVATRWVLDQPGVGAVIIGKCEILLVGFQNTHTRHAFHYFTTSFVCTIMHHFSLPPTSIRSDCGPSSHTHLRGGPLLPIRNIHHHTAIRVYLGVRMGIAEHKDDNKKVFGFSLTAEDNDDIQAVLERSNGDKLIATIGDCGAEYR